MKRSCQNFAKHILITRTRVADLREHDESSHRDRYAMQGTFSRVLAITRKREIRRERGETLAMRCSAQCYM